ncbi:hypothetical protein [Pseudobacillus wudalianchiensis]|uniref:Uncharacterized protein n=1 Tax=Pseudobacillus wudalianchiensis TaxID=1743143 RepID=A0A1B9B9B2_9BACI|nr:hypothetical protein [Bacillus wudalianchiensis]OCA92661.1 hypothetical protein A8F95_02930 [Bacillus wudalianchiensis]
MRSKAFRMLVMYVAGEEVIAGVFDNQIAVLEQTFPYKKQPLAEMCLYLLASLDREGINLSKLKVVCVPGALEEATARSQKDVDEGIRMARYIADYLNIPAHSAFSSDLLQTKNRQSAYHGDHGLLFLAEKALLMLTGED